MKGNKILGILLLLVYVCVATAILNANFIGPFNLQNMLRSSSMFAIIGIGAVFVIATGGIDLSIGSLIGLVGCTMTLTIKSWLQHPPAENGSFLMLLFGYELIGGAACWVIYEAVFLKRNPFTGNRLFKSAVFLAGILLVGVGYWIAQREFGNWLTVAVAVALALLLSIHMGLLHGILITKLHLQPFVVTLCGLMCYRGLARWFTGDRTQGLGTEYNETLRLLAIGKPSTATAVLLAGGVAMILFGIWRAIFGRASERRQEIAVGLTLAVLGLVLALVCGSRYWEGWRIEYGQSLMRIGDSDLRFFKLVLPESAVRRPAELMRFAVYPLIVVTGLFFLAAAISARSINETQTSKWLSIIIPTALVGGSIAGLFWIKRWIGVEPVILEGLEGETIIERVRGIFLSEVNRKMAGVFSFMAVLMGSIVWISRDWIRRTGGVGRVLWISTLFFALLWLLGMTSICETVVQTPFFILVAVAVLAAIFLNQTVWGRYMKALGNNEEAARYSGVKIDQMKILAYVLCAFCGGLGAILFTLDSNNVEPSGHGSFFELYAIAAAVLGGSSLRGGEGSILGVIIGATIMRVLYNAPDMIGIASQLEMFTIGIVILIGVIVDETLRRWGGKRN